MSVGVEFGPGASEPPEKTMNKVKKGGRTPRRNERRMTTPIQSSSPSPNNVTFLPRSREQLNSVHEESENNSFSIDNDDDQFGKMFIKMNSGLVKNPVHTLSKRKESEPN